MFGDVKNYKCKKRRRPGVALRIWDLDLEEEDWGKLEILEEDGKMGQGIYATTEKQDAPHDQGRDAQTRGKGRGPGSLSIGAGTAGIGVLAPERIWAERRARASSQAPQSLCVLVTVKKGEG